MLSVIGSQRTSMLTTDAFFGIVYGDVAYGGHVVHG